MGGAAVRALTADGKSAGSGTTDAAGTFAVTLSAPAEAAEVTCRYCAPRRVGVPSATEPLAIIVTQYRALSNPGLNQRDFQNLPYRRPSDALSLVPYLVPSKAYAVVGESVSDRGLDMGYPLVLDQGAPTYDLSGQASAFATVPDRAIQHVDIVPASGAYRYGNYAGGGTFVLDERGDAPSALQFDSGVDGTLAGYASSGRVSAAVAESRDGDDGALRRRAGLDYEGDFAGGILRGDAVVSGQQAAYGSAATAIDDNLLHVAYATASRRYRTFADAAASQTGLQDSYDNGGASAASSAVVASLRVEHPATITSAFGFVGQQYTGTYAIPVLGPPLDLRLCYRGAYVEVQAASARASFDAALSVAQAAVQTSKATSHRNDDVNLVLPSLSGSYSVGGGFSLHASASSSFRAATMADLIWMAPGQTIGYERGSLLDAGVGYDDARRFRLDTTLLTENLAGFANQRMTGVGASLTWQVAPLVALRAWTLHDSATLTSPPLFYLPAPRLGLSHGVVWLQYENRSSVRLDVIVHRESVHGPPETDLDADLLVALSRRLSATLGTSRLAGTRSFYAGLRLP